jgi:predicted acylesterase/phospholipase RssA
MRIPLGVVATDVVTGEPSFSATAAMWCCPSAPVARIPACSSRCAAATHLLVDGAISMEVPALLARLLGATHVISLHLPMQGAAAMPTNMFHVINRCFQILHSRTETPGGSIPTW